MGKELFERRKNEFKEIVMREKRMPKIWEFRFSDREDMRLWFNKISALDKFKDFIDEINILLNQFGGKILTNKEKEEEFFRCIEKLNRIPKKGEEYFSDGDEMYMWYMRYKKNHPNFEMNIHGNLSEYKELDLAEIWTTIREEFVKVIKLMRRIPKHGEVVLQNGIDVRVIFDKLESFDPYFVERLMLHLQTYNKNSLTIDERKQELIDEVSKLGYIPVLQESRFSDKTDMFTWYMRYKKILTTLEGELNSCIIKPEPNREVNIYLIPNFKNKGGKFYTICTNVGERLDLSEVNSYEEALELDSTIVKRGGVILKQDEEIGSVNFKKGKFK